MEVVLDHWAGITSLQVKVIKAADMEVMEQGSEIAIMEVIVEVGEVITGTEENLTQITLKI